MKIYYMSNIPQSQIPNHKYTETWTPQEQCQEVVCNKIITEKWLLPVVWNMYRSDSLSVCSSMKLDVLASIL